MALRARITDMLGIEYPIVQGGKVLRIQRPAGTGWPNPVMYRAR